MTNDSFDATRKVAIVLLSLDQGVAADLLGRLPREAVDQVTLAIANAQNVSRDEQEQVLQDFRTAFLSRPLIQSTGPDAARELLERALDQTEVEPVQQRFEEQVQAGAFAFLIPRDADEIRMLIDQEHPQTIALIASQLPPQLSARVLAGFLPQRQAEILSRLASIGPTDAETLKDIASLLRQRLGAKSVRTDGMQHAADVLRETARSTTHSVLSMIDQKDTELAESIRQTLFSFQDLGSLSDETLAIVLDETGGYRWAVALKGCSDKLCQRIFLQLSSPLRKELKAEMSSSGPLRLSEITEVQRQIAAAILALDVEGRIELPQPETKKRKGSEAFKRAV
jgi:flagellar motor switch protein FliG